jgi:plasmid replication initiation protein
MNKTRRRIAKCRKRREKRWAKSIRRLVDFAQHRITQAVWMHEIQRRANADILRSLHTEAVNAYLVEWKVQAQIDPALSVKFTIATE